MLPGLRRASRVVRTMAMSMRTDQDTGAQAGALPAYLPWGLCLPAYRWQCTPLQRPVPEPVHPDEFGPDKAHRASGRLALLHHLFHSPMLRRHNVDRHAVVGRFPVFSTVDFSKKRCRKWLALFSGVLAGLCDYTGLVQQWKTKRNRTWLTSPMAHGPA